jgi:hypothetical protein
MGCVREWDECECGLTLWQNRPPRPHTPPHPTMGAAAKKRKMPKRIKGGGGGGLAAHGKEIKHTHPAPTHLRSHQLPGRRRTLGRHTPGPWPGRSRSRGRLLRLSLLRLRHCLRLRLRHGLVLLLHEVHLLLHKLHLRVGARQLRRHRRVREGGRGRRVHTGCTAGRCSRRRCRPG